MRGAHGDLPENAGVLGIIPADAGSTNYDSFMYSDTEDHPRGCGEHATAQVRVSPEWGSSPRMRGAPVIKPGGHPYGGIIPADAGSTFAKHLQSINHQDHPRGCGEHVLKRIQRLCR